MNKILTIAAAVIVIGLAAYFVFLSPTASKPFIEKPIGTEINDTHIVWLANELGAYKLHPNPLNGEKPIMQIVASQPYTIIVDNGNPVIIDDITADPDIVITTQDQYVAEIINAKDVNAKVVELYNLGKISIQKVANDDELALKGYVSLYNSFSAS